jgi:hypothetical protein
MDRVAEISALHAEYQRLTGQRVALAGREWTWFEWLKRDLTLDDLRLLIRDKQRRIRARELSPTCLLFRYLIGNLDYAEEDILLLRAKQRIPVPDAGRADVLRATGRPTAEPPPPARKASDVVQKIASDPAAAAAALEELRKFKNSL